jgi:hypothetical protein
MAHDDVLQPLDIFVAGRFEADRERLIVGGQSRFAEREGDLPGLRVKSRRQLVLEVLAKLLEIFAGACGRNLRFGAQGRFGHRAAPLQGERGSWATQAHSA